MVAASSKSAGHGAKRERSPNQSVVLLVPRGGVPWASNINAVRWQTATRGSFDPQRLSGAVSNPPLGVADIHRVPYKCGAPLPPLPEYPVVVTVPGAAQQRVRRAGDRAATRGRELVSPARQSGTARQRHCTEFP